MKFLTPCLERLSIENSIIGLFKSRTHAFEDDRVSGLSLLASPPMGKITLSLEGSIMGARDLAP
jgi:hypothetical protein